MTSTVTLYSRPGCHLCDEAREILVGLVRQRDGLHLAEVDIDSDDNLLRRYLERIPVVEHEGRVIGELVPDAESLRARLLNTSPQ